MEWMLGKMNELPVYITPNHHPPKMDAFPKTFHQIILAAKWQLQHSSTSPNSSDDLLPSLLSVSFSMPSPLCSKYLSTDPDEKIKNSI